MIRDSGLLFGPPCSVRNNDIIAQALRSTPKPKTKTISLKMK